MAKPQDDFAALLHKIDLYKDLENSHLGSYLVHFLLYRNYYLEIFQLVLDEVVTGIKKDKSQITLVDYGAGCGMLGFLAKHSGFGKVIMVDFNPEFTRIEKLLGSKLNISIDEYICGDSEALNSIDQRFHVSAIAGTEVIEHVYNLDKFFETIGKMKNRPLTVFTTSANNSNYFKKRSLMRLQKTDEWKGWQSSEVLGLGERQMSFREIRKQMICGELNNLPINDLEKLVSATRGMNHTDIVIACENFRKQNIYPEKLSHPTNTCDPDSGSWTERLMSLPEYREIYSRYGYDLEVRNGFYNEFTGGVKGITLKVLNGAIKILGGNAKYFSPFIMLTGKSVS